jgi:hypothetical protein
MKTIVRKGSNISLCLYKDEVIVEISNTNIKVTDHLKILTILDCDESNAIVYENVIDPGDWKEWKYLYDGISWSLNADYVAPPQQTNNDISST